MQGESLLLLLLLLPHETAAVSGHSGYTIHPCTMSLHAKPQYIRKVHACLSVPATCTFGRMTGIFYVLLRLHGGGTDKSQHRKLTVRRKFTRRSCRDSNPRPFDHESGALTTEPSPLSGFWFCYCCVLFSAPPLTQSGRFDHAVTAC